MTELPRPRTRTSESAVFALVLGIASLVCVGPFAGIPAAILGTIAWLETRRSPGRVAGAGMAISGGVLGLVGSVGWVVALVVLAKTGALVTAPTPPPAFTAPVAPPTARPTPTPGAGRTDDGGQMTPNTSVVETRAGSVSLVDVPPSVRSLSHELVEQRKKAAAGREKLVVFTVAEQCRPCMSIAAIMLDPKMQAALDHVRLVRVDIDDAREELHAMGIETNKIPGFYLIGADGRAVDGINGGEWDDDVADNAAPVLGAFVRGTLARRKERFVPLPAIPRPAPTMLLPARKYYRFRRTPASQ
jgi:hypothetical protein